MVCSSLCAFSKVYSKFPSFSLLHDESERCLIQKQHTALFTSVNSPAVIFMSAPTLKTLCSNIHEGLGPKLWDRKSHFNVSKLKLNTYFPAAVPEFILKLLVLSPQCRQKRKTVKLQP